MRPPNAPENELSVADNITKPIDDKSTDKMPPIYRLADLLDEFASDVAMKHKAREEGRKLGPSTGHPKLDKLLGEYLVNGLHLIQGAPGTGKSAFALQMAGHCGFPALYISTEMQLIELLRRTTARETKTYLGKLKTGELGPRESVRLAMEAAKVCSDLALVDAVSSRITPEQIRLLAVALKEGAGADHVLIILDSAHAWIRQRIAISGRDEYSETNTAIGDLLEIADTMKCPVVTINHKTREGNKGNSAQAHSSKGSGLWEYQVDTGIDLGLDENAVTDAEGEKTVWANVWKNRNGEPNVKQALKFHGGFQSFREDDQVRQSYAKARAAAATNSGSNSGAKKKTTRDELKEYYDVLE